METVKERYDALDGLRAISCLGIIAMHIQANAEFRMAPAAETVVKSWTHFVPLFLMLSGFGMFCGYYEKVKSGTVDLNRFYTRRYKKLLPFFITLILIDLVMDRSLAHLIEGLTEATLVFGLLPNNQPDVIGVSWTLGVIFLFYMLFPFVVYLCWNKRRAVFSFLSAIVLSLFCSFYFFSEKFVIAGFASRHNFLFCAPWILGGGLVYLLRESIKPFAARHRWLWLLGCCGLSVAWYFVPVSNDGFSMLKDLLLFLPWLIYAISTDSPLLHNRVTHYISGISLELYLAQMVVFRALEKLHVLYLLGHGWLGFTAVWLAVVAGLILFIELWKRLWGLVQKRLCA